MTSDIEFSKEISLIHDVLVSPSNPGITFSWQNLGFSVMGEKNDSKKIISDLNGLLPPFSSLAILGASGAGKSTMLDVLAGRKEATEGVVSGKILVNGHAIANIRDVSRYCTQDDALFGNLTVYETLYYAARFQMGDDEDIPKAVDQMINLLGLDAQRNTIIGTPLLKGCSGGQVRRVSVGLQCFGMDGGILFLDEPTSGLDSVAAFQIINRVQSLCKKNGTTMVATIHQPSSECFNLFSHVLLLGAGSTVYFGPMKDLVTYFDDIGQPFPPYCNPSDEMLRLTNIDFSADEAERNDELNRVKKLVQAFHNSTCGQQLVASVENESHRKSVGFEKSLKLRASLYASTSTLFERALLNAAKNPLSYWVRVIMYAALGVLMATNWLNQDAHDQKTINDRLAAIFFSVAFLSFMSVAGIPAFLEERLVFVREIASGFYGVEAWIISNTLISFPFIFIITIVFSCITYFAMGMSTSDSDKFGNFVGYLFLALLCAEAQTVMISVLLPIFIAALTVGAFMNGLWMVVQGFFKTRQNMIAFWRYSFHYIDFQKYAYEALVRNEFKDTFFYCTNTTSGSTSSCFCSFPPSVPGACTFTGDDVISYYQYFDVSYQNWAIILGAIYIFYRLVTYAWLKYRYDRK